MRETRTPPLEMELDALGSFGGQREKKEGSAGERKGDEGARPLVTVGKTRGDARRVEEDDPGEEHESEERGEAGTDAGGGC